MPLGWIDFSKSERSKILSVLDLLSENGTLDELGISPVREGFANLFFPGTSTIQTRAKYFFIVPYALKDLEMGKEMNPTQFLKVFDAVERNCGEILFENNRDEDGIIGKRSLASNNWVKRTPANIYWAGMRRYGIFTGGNIALSEYTRIVCNLKKKKDNVIRLGNRRDGADDNECDDKNAGDTQGIRFWNMPIYYDSWKDDLNMALTDTESKFLKEQIIKTCPNSMMAFVLQNKIKEFQCISNFEELADIIKKFPEQIQEDYQYARSFSEFNYVLRIVYNIVLSDEKNEQANRMLDERLEDLQDIASLDLEWIYNRLGLQTKSMTCKFLSNAQKLMLSGNVNELKKCVRDREVYLKGVSRARTAHPGEFDVTTWFGGDVLAYRFYNAKTIIKDIFAGEEAVTNA